MKKILTTLGSFGIVIGISALILFSSFGLAGFSSYFYYDKAPSKLQKSDSVRVVVSPKGNKEWQIVP